MHCSPARVGVTCAALLVGPIAFAQQSPAPTVQAPPPVPAQTQSPALTVQSPSPVPAVRTPSQTPVAKTLSQTPAAKTSSPARPAATPMTWTLFLVTVPYNGTWTISSVAAFSTKDTAHADCLRAIGEIDAIPGLRQFNQDARKSETSQEYMLCLPATAGGGSPPRSGNAGPEK